MHNKKQISVIYDPKLPRIVSTTSGTLTLDDIQSWSRLLTNEINHNCQKRRFKLLLDAYGFEPTSLCVLKSFHDSLTQNELIAMYCVASAHVHHSRDKMDLLQGQASETLGFFTESTKAYAWLHNVKI